MGPSDGRGLRRGRPRPRSGAAAQGRRSGPPGSRPATLHLIGRGSASDGGRSNSGRGCPRRGSRPARQRDTLRRPPAATRQAEHPLLHEGDLGARTRRPAFLPPGGDSRAGPHNAASLPTAPGGARERIACAPSRPRRIGQRGARLRSAGRGRSHRVAEPRGDRGHRSSSRLQGQLHRPAAAHVQRGDGLSPHAVPPR